MDELTVPFVDRVEVEGRTRDGFLNTPRAGETSNKGGLTCAQVAVQCEYGVDGQNCSYSSGECFGLDSASRADASY